MKGVHNYYTPSKGRPSLATGTTAHDKLGHTKQGQAFSCTETDDISENRVGHSRAYGCGRNRGATWKPKRDLKKKEDLWLSLLAIPIGSKSTCMRGQKVDRLKLIII